MLKMSAKRYLTALVSVMAIGAAFSFGATQARAGDVTEDQIVNALTPAKKPLTRGLSIGGEGRQAGRSGAGEIRLLAQGPHPRR